MVDKEDLGTKVAFLVKKRFPVSAVQSVLVVRGLDNDGGKILRVTVVVDKKLESLDRQSMLGLVGNLHNDLAENEIEDYPLISFVSENDAPKLIRETA